MAALIYLLLFFLLVFLVIHTSNTIILNKLSESNKLRIWWEKHICTSKDLEPYD